MTWTDDKEAEHQRIRADFAEADVKRLRKALELIAGVSATPAGAKDARLVAIAALVEVIAEDNSPR